MVDGLETDLILQAEDKDDRIHPHGKLQREEWRRAAERGPAEAVRPDLCCVHCGQITGVSTVILSVYPLA